MRLRLNIDEDGRVSLHDLDGEREHYEDETSDLEPFEDDDAQEICDELSDSILDDGDEIAEIVDERDFTGSFETVDPDAFDYGDEDDEDEDDEETEGDW